MRKYGAGPEAGTRLETLVHGWTSEASTTGRPVQAQTEMRVVAGRAGQRAGAAVSHPPSGRVLMGRSLL